VLTGVDLADAEERSNTAATVHAALLEHGVVFVKGQSHVSDKDIVSFAKEFGMLEGPHPIYSPDPSSPLAVVAHDAVNLPDGAEWHSDCSWSESPPFGSVLWPKILPRCGGDTLWLCTATAFSTLPVGMQADLRGLDAVHDMGSFRNNFAAAAAAGGGGGGSNSALEGSDVETAGHAITRGHQQFGSAVHPIVQAHPVTGRECLFVNECFTSHIVGMMVGVVFC
jgi:taurine dioxygenase